ncbi:MAG TPA: cyclic nucleotide-binding domain-containing protein [Gaiellaceae bacterium]|jgi:CRP-like cAMP-binding protein|nr:cyclic nucleotide-binding domain-containing protein [Gaiellaceae bacterium]
MNGTDVDTLSRLALFADLARPQLEAIAHTYDEEVFPEGQRVLRQGLTGSNLYVILDGEAAVVIHGTERTRIGGGQFFGDVSALLETPPTADVVATTPLRCLVVPSADLERFLVSYPAVAVRMLRELARRLATTLEWLG